MNMITQEQLKTLKPQTQISGVILVRNYDIQLTKNNKEYVVGTLQSGVDIPFKAWSSSVAFTKLKNEAYENVPAFISGMVDNYGGATSIVVDNVQAVEGYTPDQFLLVKYNMEAYWTALVNKMSENVSQKGMDICNAILFNNEELAKRFQIEFAAMTHHDNCKSGLLAHTYKVLSLMSTVIRQYPSITVRPDAESKSNYVDLLYIGVLLHDIGKVIEMNLGVYQPLSYVTHRYFGVEFIAPYRDKIIKAYDEDWYYQLISIMLQHHGEYGERCKTVASYLVHLVDNLDSQLTAVADKFDTLESVEGQKIKIEGAYLTI